MAQPMMSVRIREPTVPYNMRMAAVAPNTNDANYMEFLAFGN